MSADAQEFIIYIQNKAFKIYIKINIKLTNTYKDESSWVMSIWWGGGRERKGRRCCYLQAAIVGTDGEKCTYNKVILVYNKHSDISTNSFRSISVSLPRDTSSDLHLLHVMCWTMSHSEELRDKSEQLIVWVCCPAVKGSVTSVSPDLLCAGPDPVLV